MRAAYLYQSVNLIVGILMVPVLLRFLDPGQFVLWSIFTTFGGLTLQLESSIQIVAVRRMASEFHAQQLKAFQAAVGRTRRAYRVLASITLFPVAIAGCLYLFFVANSHFSTRWATEWGIFIVTYGVNYIYGSNSAALLALNRVNTYSHITSFTRLLNFSATLWSLAHGYGIFGICASFALSVAVNCTLIAAAARRALQEPLAISPRQSLESTDVAIKMDIVRYTFFTVASYALYKAGVLTAAWFYPKEEVSGYSLMLQAYTMLTSFALVPIQVRLPQLVRSLLANHRQDILHELGRTALIANGVFLSGTLSLVTLGHVLISLLGAKTALPSTADLLLAAIAFAIELNLFILINLLLTQRRFNFVKVYLSCAVGGLLAAAAAILSGQPLATSLILTPALIQGLVCLPSVLRLVCSHLNITLREFGIGVWNSVLGRV